MAARLKVRHQDDIRAKIRVGLLVRFLEDHALTGKPYGKNTLTRIRAASILLDKTLPSLQMVQADPEAPPPPPQVSVKIDLIELAREIAWTLRRADAARLPEATATAPEEG